MPQYRCEHVSEIRREGSRQELLAALAHVLHTGQPDIASWKISAHGADLYRWSGAVTVSRTVIERCRRDALRRFLYDLDLPEDVLPCDVVVTEVATAVELDPAPTTIPVPEGIRAVPRYPEREFDGLTEAGA